MREKGSSSKEKMGLLSGQTLEPCDEFRRDVGGSELSNELLVVAADREGSIERQHTSATTLLRLSRSTTREDALNSHSDRDTVLSDLSLDVPGGDNLFLVVDINLRVGGSSLARWRRRKGSEKTSSC